MTTFERIKELASRKNKNLQKIANDLGYGENYFYSLNTGKQPSAKRLSEIAQYFNVSVDYLLTGKDNEINTTKHVDLTDKSTIFSFDGKPISDEDLAVINRVLRGLKDSGEL